jgi:uncharacterized coiled-coil protein SlyX
MNDPLRLEEPGGFRNAVYGMLGSMAVFIVTIVWYGGQIEARLESRVKSLEDQQSISRVVLDKLNDAREESRVHGAKVDMQLTEMTDKLGAILGIIQQDPTQFGGTPNGGPENFRPPPKGRGQ